MKALKTFLQKHRISISMLLIFTLIGILVGTYKGLMYFFLFSGIGMFEMSTRIFIEYYPKTRQIIRILLQAVFGLFFLIWLGMFKGVNFQFPQITFDIYNGIITGAVIQLVVSRLFLPFIFGNAFCSRACWTGLFFELTNKKSELKNNYKRNQYLAFGYLLFLSAFVLFFIFIWNPIQDDNFRRIWIIAENLIITLGGLILMIFMGSRSYCRLLCPFLTISSFIAPYSFYKITPVNASNCTGCNSCNSVCPMLINISDYVKENKAINNKWCIVCERCVSTCTRNVLKLSNKIIQ